MSCIEEINNYISETASTWVPENVLSQFPIRELQKGLLVSRHFKEITYFTTPTIANMEKFIAKAVLKRVKKRTIDISLVRDLIQRFELEESKAIGKDFRFAPEQVEGIITLASNHFAILTGGPGTGKTSTIKCLVRVLRWLDPYVTIAFTAPTGKAARRVTESTGYDASTLQKKIGDTGEECTRLKTVHEDALITDEVSMLDMPTFYKAILAVSEQTSWYLIGDIDQLPSVGLGAILRDLIDSGLIPCCQLQQTFRQDNSSTLFENIQTVKKGGYLPLIEGADFIRINSEDNIEKSVLETYLSKVEEWGLQQAAILTPYRKQGTICSEKLNQKIKGILNPKGNGNPYIDCIIIRDDRELFYTFSVGDPVMQLVNRDECANGDVGTIVEISGKKMVVKYPDQEVVYWPDNYNQLDLAYAMSIHKSQGSEYKCVIIPLLGENRNLDRNLIYTGITRAKKECIVIGLDDIIQAACKAQSAWNRITFLCEEIQIADCIKAIVSAVEDDDNQ